MYPSYFKLGRTVGGGSEKKESKEVNSFINNSPKKKNITRYITRFRTPISTLVSLTTGVSRRQKCPTSALFIHRKIYHFSRNLFLFPFSLTLTVPPTTSPECQSTLHQPLPKQLFLCKVIFYFSILLHSLDIPIASLLIRSVTLVTRVSETLS